MLQKTIGAAACAIAALLMAAMPTARADPDAGNRTGACQAWQAPVRFPASGSARAVGIAAINRAAMAHAAAPIVFCSIESPLSHPRPSLIPFGIGCQKVS